MFSTTCSLAILLASMGISTSPFGGGIVAPAECSAD